MKPEYLTRQAELIPVLKLGKYVTVVGAGAVGSWVTLSLAKMGLSNITTWDYDEIDDENMNCQFYPFSAIGMKKASALSDLVFNFTGTRIEARNEKFVGSGATKGILICAVDSMSARKEIWEWAKTNPLVETFIDPRMGAESIMLYAMKPGDPKDRATYEKTLYSDDEAVHERCTAKATIYTANLLAGLVCKTVKDLLVSEPYPRYTTWDVKTNAMQSWPQPQS